MYVGRNGVRKQITCVNEPRLTLLFTHDVKTSGKRKEYGLTTHLATLTEKNRGDGKEEEIEKERREGKREGEDVNI